MLENYSSALTRDCEAINSAPQVVFMPSRATPLPLADILDEP
ncbi:hypothetical protein HMPREF9996_00945 [Aggregatibacter actinomycetemcomitans Y4]|nr:hypothetical protein HMPREF9996_00945 [Aggregatibacter actinomycetemcomitans Y4]